MDTGRPGTYKATQGRIAAFQVEGAGVTPGEGMAQAAMAQAAPKYPNAEPAAQEIGKATAALRRTMIDRQLRPYDVTDLTVLGRFLEVPRELFLPREFASIAYSDLALPGRGASGPASRAIPAPLVLARFLQAARIEPHHKVLDIAGGAGYSAALLSGMAAEVVALESEPELAALARANLARIGAGNVRVECGPLEKGAPECAPFDVILIHGAIENDPDALLSQLAPNGHLLAFKRLDQNSGIKAVRFERAEGQPAGTRALFDAAAPLLTAFAKAPGFEF